jgi:hypothetical protein
MRTSAWRMNSSRVDPGVDALEGHAATRGQRQPEQRGALVDGGARGAAFPVRLVVLPADQVSANLLHPERINAGDAAGVDLRRLHLLGAHDPGRLRLELAGTGMDEQFRAVGAEVLALLLALRDLGKQPREQRAVDGFVGAWLRTGLQRELALDQVHHLAVHVLPLGEAQVGEEIVLAPGAQLRARQLLPLLHEGAPQFQQRQEVRLLVAQRRVLLVGLGLLVRGPVAGVGHRQRRGDDRHFLQAELLCTREQHASQSRIQRQAGEIATDLRELSFL